MRKLHWRLARLNLMGRRAASLTLAAVSATYATPVFAQAPALMSADGPIGINQQQCLDVAKSVIVALRGTETQADHKSRAMTRGHFITSIMCFIPGRLIVVVAGPDGTDPEPELDAVLGAFVTRAGGSSAGGSSPGVGKMPALPKTYEEAWSISQPINRSFLVGRWSTESCSNGVEFHNDGTLTNYRLGKKGHWSFEGDDLTIIIDAKNQLKVRGVGKDRFFSFAAGKFSQAIRC